MKHRLVGIDYNSPIGGAAASHFNQQDVMECAGCSSTFEPRTRAPCILTRCGHSVCSICVEALFRANSIECPACKSVTQINSPAALPRNFALLALTNSNMCKKHMKALEAYCLREKLPICVRCILEDGHQTHEVLNISKAASKERDSLINALQVAKTVDSKLESASQSLLMTASQLKKKYDELSLEVTVNFDAAIEAIANRKAEVLQRLNDKLATDQKALSQAITSTNFQAGKIAELIGELRTFNTESDLELLTKSKDREAKVKAVAIKIASLSSKSVCSFNKEKELIEVIRLVKAAFSTRKPQPTSFEAKDTAKVLPTQRRTHRSTTMKSPRPKLRKTSPESTRSTSDLARQANLHRVFGEGLTAIQSGLATPRSIKVSLKSPNDPLWQEDLSTIIHADEEDCFSVHSMDLQYFCNLD